MDNQTINEKKEYLSALNIFITENCNLNCNYCFVNKNYEKTKLDFPSLKNAIDLFLSYPPQRKTIAFTGGEPLLEYSLLKKTFLYAKEKAKKQHIYLDIAVMTNGTLLSKFYAQFLQNNEAIVKISIDGNKTTHDLNRPFKDNPNKSSFEKIIQNIKNFNLPYEGLAASLVITPSTIDSFLENIKFLREKGFSYIEFYPDMYAFWSKNELKKLKKILKKFSLYYISLFAEHKEELIFKNSLLDSIVNKNEVVGITAECQKIHLASDGHFYFCDKVFSLPKKEREKYIIGNVTQLINNEKRIKLLNQVKEKILKLIKNNCQDCIYREYCFCPVGHYLYFSYKRWDFKKYFICNFCQISKIFLETFWQIKEFLKFNPLFVKIYKY